MMSSRKLCRSSGTFSAGLRNKNLFGVTQDAQKATEIHVLEKPSEMSLKILPAICSDQLPST